MNFEVNEEFIPYTWADVPKNERPKERLKLLDGSALTDSELLAVILDAKDPNLTRNLLSRFDGNLGELVNATVDELRTVKGITPSKALRLKAVFSFSDRLNRLDKVPNKFNSPAIVAEYLHGVFSAKKQEEVRVLLFDARNQLIADRLVTKGLLTTSQVHPREVFRPAIREAAARIILAHNHPSGDPAPSKQDIEVTNIIHKAGETIGIPLVDHVIIGAKYNGGPFFVSLQQRGHCG